MKKHEGKTLHEWVQASGKTVEELAKEFKTSASLIFHYYKKEKVSGAFKHKVSVAGYKIFEHDTLNNSSPKTQNLETNKNSTNNDNEKSVTNIPQEYNLTWVPLKVQGGFLKGYANRVFMDQLEYSSFPNIKGKCWGFEVEGYSMMTDDKSSIEPGDWVIATEIFDFSWLHPGKVYVFVTVEGMCVKIFDRLEEGFYHLRSANPDYPVDPIPAKDVKRIFFKEGVYSRG